MRNQSIELTPKGFLKSMSIIHGAFIAGLVMFAFAAIVLTAKKQTHPTRSGDAYAVAVPLIAVAGLIASNLIFRNKVSKLNNESSLKDKITGYQSAIIARFALIEGPALFGIAVFLLTKNWLYLIISGLLILYFVSLRPTKAKTENDLNLSYEEKLVFDKEEEIIK
jgi:hypothetical protein